jgi:outer membrane protein assembly factor BamB
MPILPKDANLFHAGSGDVRAKLVSFLREYSVIRGGDEPIVSATGQPIQWLIDTRVALFNPEMSFAIASLFWEYLAKRLPFQLCCVELTGIPLLTAIQSFAFRRGCSVSGFVIRKERKDTGRRRQIEGIVNDLPIIFLDDIVNSGDSIERADVALSNIGRKISHVVALVDFGTSRIGDKLLRDGVHLRSLIRLEELGVSMPSRPAQLESARQIFRELWKTDPDGQQSMDVVPKSVPAFDGEQVYYGTDSGTFYAHDVNSGEVKWRFVAGKDKYKGVRSSPLLHNGLVYFGAYDGVFYALEKMSGQICWQFTDADWIGSSACSSTKSNMLFVGLEHALRGRRGSLVALDMSSGWKCWEHNMAGLVHSSPCFIEDLGYVVVGNNDGKIHCVDASTGELTWSATTDGPIKGRPCYDPGRGVVVAGSFDKNVYAWDARTGETVWKAQTDALIFSDPLIVQNTVYVCSSDKHLHMLRVDDGSHIFRFYAGAKLFSAPSICRERIYFASTAGTVFEFDPSARSVIGTHVIHEKIANKIVCDESTNRFYISTIDGQLFAFERR